MSFDVAGHLPALMRLSLIDGQDFAHPFEATGSDLPDGSVVTLEMLTRDRTFSYGSWAAEHANGLWTVRIDADDHADVPHGSWFRLWVLYPSDGGRYCWIAGPIERNRR